MSDSDRACLEPINEPFSDYRDILAELSEEQFLAASSDAHASLVLAGAGTGKTRVLIARLAYLYGLGSFQESTVLMLAFARKAAAEMRERIEQLLPRLCDSVEVGTFHSLGLQIVSEVTGSVPQLTELSSDEALSHFIRQRFFELCARDSLYLTAYFKWVSFSSSHSTVAQSLRSLNDEYVLNRAELICANVLYQFDIDYFYRPHYPYQHQWVRYQSYQPGFYLVKQDIYLEVYDLSKESLEQQQLDSRQRYLGIHAQHQTTLLEFFVDHSLEEFYEKVSVELSRFKQNHRQRGLRIARSAFHYEQLIKQLCHYLPIFKHELYWPDLEPLLGRDGQLLNALLKPIWTEYQDHLEKTGTIDFEKMIVLATEYVRSGAFTAPWDEIMIDEFQDISAHRAELIQAIREQRPDIRLFCVGDDWQAIYRFAGSDLRYTTNFEHYFGEVRRYALSHTYRFGEILSKESSRFVLQNPVQSRKTLKGDKGHQNPLILCPVEQLPQRQWIVTVLDAIQQDNMRLTPDLAQNRCTVLILSRFHHFLPSARQMQHWTERFPTLELRQGTVHGVKGNEADYVVLLEVNRGEFGFPSEKISDRLVESFLPETESFSFAEERRLFYVALTRAKQQVYINYSESKASSFIDELKTDYQCIYLSDVIQAIKQGNKAKRISWSPLSIFKLGKMVR